MSPGSLKPRLPSALAVGVQAPSPGCPSWEGGAEALSPGCPSWSSGGRQKPLGRKPWTQHPEPQQEPREGGRGKQKPGAQLLGCCSAPKFLRCLWRWSDLRTKSDCVGEGQLSSLPSAAGLAARSPRLPAAGGDQISWGRADFMVYHTFFTAVKLVGP